MCGGTEVCFAIVEAVAVYVVNEEKIGDVQDLAVHFDCYLLFDFGQPELSLGVVGVPTPVGVPFVSGEARVVIRVNDGVLALCEWDSAERVAEAEAAVGEYERNGDSFEPRWDCDLDEENQDGASLGIGYW